LSVGFGFSVAERLACFHRSFQRPQYEVSRKSKVNTFFKKTKKNDCFPEKTIIQAVYIQHLQLFAAFTGFENLSYFSQYSTFFECESGENMGEKVKPSVRFRGIES
jgi:uncharacterized membrane protein YbaN (DUF454 family)